MYCWEILTQILSSGVIPVVRAESPERAGALLGALQAGGTTTLELTMTVPGAVELLRELAPAYRQQGVLLGAGSVLDAVSARLCLLAGAEFLVTPCVVPEVAEMARLYQKPVIMGAQSVTEVRQALAAGAHIVKLFPASHLGPGFLKAVRGPLPQAPCIPTGGVKLEAVGEWIKAGAVAVGAGSELTGAGDLEQVTQRARAYLQEVRAARGA